MTSASITSTPTRTPSRRRKPAPVTILNLYHHEVAASGPRGAANRVAAALAISDDTVRRVVARDEAARKAREETPPELQYSPPDAAYEQERAAANARFVAELAAKTSQMDDPAMRPIMSTSELNMRNLLAETPQPLTALDRNPEPITDDPSPAETPQDVPSPMPDRETPETLPINPGPALDPQTPTVLPDVAPFSDPLNNPDMDARSRKAQPVIMRERVVLRVPVERPPSPLVAWAHEHMPPVQLVTAIVAFLFLVALTWIG